MKLFAITNAKWSKNEAKVGDVVKLSAEVEGYEDGTKAVFEIFEHDLTGADFLVTKIEATVQGKKVEAKWTYEYHETNQPETGNSALETQNSELETERYSSPVHYFIVKIEGDKARSGQLEFQDWIEIKLKHEKGTNIGNVKYKLLFPNGESRKGTLNPQGIVKLEDIPLGEVKIMFERDSLYREASKKGK
jgi:hypothetical protein